MFKNFTPQPHHKHYLGWIGLLALIMTVVAGIGHTNPLNEVPPTHAEIVNLNPATKIGETNTVNIQLTDAVGLPAASQWVALYMRNSNTRTPDHSRNGFYSEDGRETFKRSDANGMVSFDIVSTVSGKVKYEPVLGLLDKEESEAQFKKIGKAFEISFFP